MPRLVLVPRWSGTADSDFYPWLRAELAPRGVDIAVAELLPVKDAPEIEPTVEPIVKLLAERPTEPVGLAPSAGCRPAPRALARRSADVPPVRGAVLVAAWLHIDSPWPTILPWTTTPFDAARARAGVTELHALLSDDDPFTADHEATRAELEQLGARVSIPPGAKPFTAAPQPAVLAALEALLAAAAC